MYENDNFHPSIIFIYSIEARNTSPDMGIGRKGSFLMESFSVQQSKQILMRSGYISE
jgi:hypothetical protein